MTEKAPPSLHAQVTHSIEKNILYGAWKPGMRLPSEAELCRLYNTSRITIRRALATLEQRGLITRRQGSGTYACHPTGQQLDIRILVPRGYIEVATRSLTSLYTARNPRVQVHVHVEQFTTVHNMAVHLAGDESASRFDAVAVPVTFLSQAAHAGYLQPLDEYIERYAPDLASRLVCNAQGLNALELIGKRTVHGKRAVYALPYHNDVQVLYYRNDLFDELDLKPPTDMLEYMEAVKALQQRGRSLQPRLYGTVLAANPDTFCLVDSWLWILKALGGELFTADGEPAVDSEPSVQSLEILRQLYLLSPGACSRYTAYDAALAMARGEIGLMPNWHVFADLMDKPNAPVQSKVRYSLLPQGQGQLAGWGLGITTSCQYKDETFAYLAFLTGDDDEVDAVFTSKGGCSFSRNSQHQSLCGGRRQAYEVTQQTWAHGWALDEWPDYERLGFCLIPALQDVISGEVNAGTAVRRMLVALTREVQFQQIRKRFKLSFTDVMPVPPRAESEVIVMNSENPSHTTAAPANTRGLVIGLDHFLPDWPERAHRYGLTTLALHAAPSQVVKFLDSDAGKAFVAGCNKYGINLEYELHAIDELLPRVLYADKPHLFRMDNEGKRVSDGNFCPASAEALDIICENAVELAKRLSPTTHRYYFWPSDGPSWCNCPECQHLSDADQALLYANTVLKALQTYVDPEAQLAHLAYHNTLTPPHTISPEKGIFLEYAPIRRNMALPLNADDPVQERHLEALEDNLAYFGVENTQVLEYWMDVSLVSNWRRPPKELPWREEVLTADLELYTRLGIRHVTSFAVFIDKEYLALYGEPPLDRYGAILSAYVK